VELSSRGIHDEVPWSASSGIHQAIPTKCIVYDFLSGSFKSVEKVFFLEFRDLLRAHTQCRKVESRKQDFFEEWPYNNKSKQ